MSEEKFSKMWRFLDRANINAQEIKKELASMHILPTNENIKAVYIMQNTPQWPEWYDEMYKNLDNPEKLKTLMKGKRIKKMVHVEWPTVRDHIKLAMKTVEGEDIKSRLITLYHDLGKNEVYDNDLNKRMTIGTVTSWKLFQVMTGHADASQRMIKEGLKSNGLDSKAIEFCMNIIRNHMQRDILERKDPIKINAFFEQFWKTDKEIEEAIQYLVWMFNIDHLSTDNITLRDDGTLEYSKDVKEKKFSYEAMIRQYKTAAEEAKKIIQKKENIREKQEDCDKYLPKIASHIIQENPENQDLKNNPDSIEGHYPRRHQFGIITHSKKTIANLEIFRNWLPKQMVKIIDGKLSENIWDKTKEELLSIALEFHDIGKFARRIIHDKDWKEIHDFTWHEDLGEQLLLHDEYIRHLIQDAYKLSDIQIEYIAKCIWKHFELSKVRGVSIITWWYNMEFASSKELEDECNKIIKKNPGLELEIGLLNLIDGLAKTEFWIFGKTDEDIQAKIPEAKWWLKDKNVAPEHIDAVTQKPVNIAIAKKYFRCLFPQEE